MKYAIRVLVTEIDDENIHSHDVLDITVMERDIDLPIAITLGQRVVASATKVLEKNNG